MLVRTPVSLYVYAAVAVKVVIARREELDISVIIAVISIYPLRILRSIQQLYSDCCLFVYHGSRDLTNIGDSSYNLNDIFTGFNRYVSKKRILFK